jgi:leucyl-tRNA synthetase
MADRGFLRLYAFLDWVKQMLGLKGKRAKESETSKDEQKMAKPELRGGEPNTFADLIFENEMNRLITLTAEHYEKTFYKEALKTGFFDYQVMK